MGLQKGRTNNKKGRPKGAPNKVTGDIRDVLKTVLSKELTPVKLSHLLGKLEPQARLNAMAKLLEFTIPKLQSISVQAQIEAEYQALEKLLRTAPDEAVKQIYERINNLKDEQTGDDK